MDNIKIRLNDFADIFSGFAFSTKNDMSDYGIPILKIGNIIGNGDISTETDSFYPHPISKKISKYFLKNNDFLVAMTGATIGKIGRIKVKDDSFLVNQRVAIVRAKNNVNSRFLYYFLSQKIFQKYIDNISNGSAQANISAENIGKFLIDNKILKISQNKIASILSAYDDLIEVNNKKIKTLNEMAQEIYKEWFVRFRFPGHEKVEFQNGIPKGWEIVKLEKFGYDIESGNRPKGGIDTTLTNGVPSLGAEHIKTLGFFDYNDIKLISSDFYEQMKKGIGKDKNILLYKDGAYIGKVTIFMDDFPFKDYAVNEHVFLINAKEQAYQFYLYYTLNQTHYFLQMQNLNRNSAQPGLTPADLNILKLMKPEIKIVEKFNNVIHSILKNIFSLSKTNEKLKTQRDLLLPRLMSGKLEVKG